MDIIVQKKRTEYSVLFGSLRKERDEKHPCLPVPIRLGNSSVSTFFNKPVLARFCLLFWRKPAHFPAYCFMCNLHLFLCYSDFFVY